MPRTICIDFVPAALAPESFVLGAGEGQPTPGPAKLGVAGELSKFLAYDRSMGFLRWRLRKQITL